MKRSVITLQPKEDQFELCIGEYDGDTRLRHEDYTLSYDTLWELKHQVDRELLEHGIRAGRITLGEPAILPNPPV